MNDKIYILGIGLFIIHFFITLLFFKNKLLLFTVKYIVILVILNITYLVLLRFFNHNTYGNILWVYPTFILNILATISLISLIVIKYKKG